MKDNSSSKDKNGIAIEYIDCISDLIENKKLFEMKGLRKHGDVVDCLDHCFFVSYYSYLACKRLRMDYRAAARAGLLHDFYLYPKDEAVPRGHSRLHPKLALKNACECYELSDREKDIIKRHMWPITIAFPRYKESYVVDIVDKYCTFLELKSSKKLSVLEDIRRIVSY